MVRLRFFMKNKIRIKSPKWQSKFLQQKWCFSATRELLLNGKTQYGKCWCQIWCFSATREHLLKGKAQHDKFLRQKWCFGANREPSLKGRLSTVDLPFCKNANIFSMLVHGGELYGSFRYSKDSLVPLSSAEKHAFEYISWEIKKYIPSGML